MTVWSVPVSPPTQISQSSSGPFLLQNSGDVTCYLGTDTSLTKASRLLTLGPGANVFWPGSDSLYAISETGMGELERLEQAGVSVTPGPTTVGINGPVTTSGSFATLIGNRTVNLPLAVTVDLYDTPADIDLTLYSSLRVSGSLAGGAWNGEALSLDITQSGAPIGDESDTIVFVNTNGNFDIEIPIVGSAFSVAIVNLTGVTQNLTYNIVLTSVIDVNRVRSQVVATSSSGLAITTNLQLLDSKLLKIVGTCPALNSGFVLFPVIAGRAHVTVTGPQTGTGGLRFFLNQYMAGSPGQVVGITKIIPDPLVPANRYAIQDVNFGYSFGRLDVSNLDAAVGSFELDVVWE